MLARSNRRGGWHVDAAGHEARDRHRRLLDDRCLHDAVSHLVGNGDRRGRTIWVWPSDSGVDRHGMRAAVRSLGRDTHGEVELQQVTALPFSDVDRIE